MGIFPNWDSSIGKWNCQAFSFKQKSCQFENPKRENHLNFRHPVPAFHLPRVNSFPLVFYPLGYSTLFP